MTAQPSSGQFLPSVRSAGNVFAPVQRELNRLFEDLGAGWSAFTDAELLPKMDIRETKDAIEITAELPGLDRNEVSIAVEDDILTISGEKKSEKETKTDTYRLSERSYGAFSRSITVPRAVNAEKIKATMANGVLKIVAPKDGVSSAKTIKIEAAK